MGGLAVAFGLLASFLSAYLLMHCFGVDGRPMGYSPAQDYLGVASAILVMLLTGIIDDVRQLSALSKFFLQIAAACIAASSGVVIEGVVSPFDGSIIEFGWLAWPITVFYLVSFANCINLIDGIDGLATGIVAMVSASLFVVSFMVASPGAAVLAAMLTGASLGFLRWNFNPAKIFLGDSGSLTLGFSLGLIALMSAGKTASLTGIIVPVIMVGVPVLDTFAAIVRRARVNVSIATPDKGHIHHRLLARGFGQRAVVGIIYGFTALLCLSAIAATQVPVFWRVIFVLFVLVMALLLAMYLRMFVPVVRKRFDLETGENEVVPINEVDESEDLTHDEIASAILGGMGGEPQHAYDRAKAERPLRILAVSQHYWPEPFSHSDVCEALAAMGHDVTALVGTPNYPDGDIYPGYEKGAQALQERNGVRIKRVRLIPRGREVWQRVLNYYSFSINASRMARKMGPGYDVVLSFQTSPVMMARPALAYGKRNNVPVLLWCLDIWPECLTVGNIKRNSLIYAVFVRVSRRIYSSADCLAISSKSFDEYYRTQLGMADVETFYLPQYAEDIFKSEAPMRDEYDLTKINLTFAGNVGVAQAVNTFVEAGHYLKGDDRFALHVVGSGSELATLKKYKEEIGADCVVFHGRHPLAEMPSFYASSDAMVGTFQNNSILGYTLPRKIISYMAAGRPVLGTVSGEARRVIEEAGCGLCCDAEDPVGLAKICKQFASMTPEQRKLMGENGRRYYREHFVKSEFVAKLEGKLQALAESGRNE